MEKFSKELKSSKQPKKQRTYRHNAPLHLRQSFVHAHLSKELRQKYKRRSLGIKKGDKVKIMRGQFNGKMGSVEKVNLKLSKVFVSGAEMPKKDGSKSFYPIDASNLMITEVNMDDKKRKKIIERKIK